MNNFLFKTYAEIVEQFFVPQRRVGSKITLAPLDKSSEKAPAPPTAHLADLIHPQGLKVTQDLVDHLRGALEYAPNPAATRETVARRRTDDTPAAALTHYSAGEAERIRTCFAEFRAAIQSGDETGLVANPFYELTKLVFHYNLDGARNLFAALQADLMDSPPRPVPLLRSFREIWFDRPTAGSAPDGAPGLLPPSASQGERLSRFLKRLCKKTADQIDTWMGMGKVAVAILLFFGSSFTTGQGINDLLQSQESFELFGGLFDGREAEMLRYGVAILVGLLLSSAILDYKDRLFSAIAEEGGVLRGLRTVVLRHPRWMILATFLTAFSIKTNYDGIVSLISKKADLARQSEQIRARVKKALGSRFFVNTVEPDDLHDIQGVLQNATADAIAKFKRVPDDEVSGVASSGDPRMGPRYWGKYFIVNGGYEPGVHDVAHSTQSLTAGFSARIDEMLRDSHLDLRPSIADKITALRQRYDNHLQQTETQVEEYLGRLRGLMEMRGYSPEEIKRVFALEHYQINELVLTMANALEENKNEYERVAGELNQLTDATVAVLQQVDKSGAASRREYHIEGKLAIPALDAIQELKNTRIPNATHKSFAELKEFLAEEYGLALANGMLLAILFLSFCMDLLDPLIYSRWTAINGRQDRSLFPDLIGYLREWENDFVVRSHQFFYRRDVQQIFNGLALPNRTGIRNAFYRLLEDLDPHLRDARDQSPAQRGGDWFKGLFRLTRTQDMHHYNQRAEAIDRFVADKERYFKQFLEYLLPGVRLEQGVTRDSFLLVAEKTEWGQEQQRVLFAWELQAVSGQLTAQTAVAGLRAGGLAGGPSNTRDAMAALEQKRKSISKLRNENTRTWSGLPPEQGPSSDIAVRRAQVSGAGLTPDVTLARSMRLACVRPEGALHPLLQPFFQPGSQACQRWQRFWMGAFLPPLPPFAHTRRRWLLEVARQDGHTMEDMDGLYDFVPDLKKVLLETLPGIRRDVMGPLADIRRHFPTRCRESGLVSDEAMQMRIDDLEKESLQVLGLSPAMGDQTRLYAPVMGTTLELEGVSRVVLDHVGGDPTRFHEKVAALVHDTAEMVQRAQDIEQSVAREMTQILKDVKRLHESIKHILLKINMGSTASRQTALPLRDMLRLLRQYKDFLEQAPNQSETILKTVEQIWHEKRLDEGADPSPETSPHETDRQHHTEATLELLRRLQGEERSLFDGLMQILVEIQGAESSGLLEQDLPNGAVAELIMAALPLVGSGTESVQVHPGRHTYDSGGSDQSPESLDLHRARHEEGPLHEGFRPDSGHSGDWVEPHDARLHGHDFLVASADLAAQEVPVVPDPLLATGMTVVPGLEGGAGTATGTAAVSPDRLAYEAGEIAEYHAEELVTSMLLVHGTEPPDAPSAFQAQAIEEASPVWSATAERESLAVAENALILVAELSYCAAGEEGAGGSPVVGAKPLSRPVRRSSPRPPMQWNLAASALADDFLSGVVPVLPVNVSATQPGPALSETPLVQGVVEPGVARTTPVAHKPGLPRSGVQPATRPATWGGGRPPLLPTALEFQTKSGIHFHGVTQDLSLNGRQADAMDLSGVQVRDTGRLRLVSDVGIHQFPCEVVEVSESTSARNITLRLFANGHQFESVTKENIFKEVWRDHQAMVHHEAGGHASGGQETGGGREQAAAQDVWSPQWNN
ncbi:MAG: hypothetical protein HQL87_13280 [Magnetococcales bacterium]|nr:hypothetical protein [Magnetococcales bacterium]